MSLNAPIPLRRYTFPLEVPLTQDIRQVMIMGVHPHIFHFSYEVTTITPSTRGYDNYNFNTRLLWLIPIRYYSRLQHEGYDNYNFNTRILWLIPMRYYSRLTEPNRFFVKTTSTTSTTSTRAEKCAQRTSVPSGQQLGDSLIRVQVRGSYWALPALHATQSVTSTPHHY
jgi:hypothetical protein